MNDEFPPPPLRQSPNIKAKLSGPHLIPDVETRRHSPDLGASKTRASEIAIASDSVSEKFGRYTIIETLGQGGMGAVYLAHDSQLDRRVALKVPHFPVIQNPNSAERFLREAQAAAALDHPNICSVYDVGQIDGTNFIAMAYVEGQTLSSLIRDNDEPLPPQGVADLIRKLALALAEAHAHGVVHRDLKPANVMINRRFEPVIMDFGLAMREEPSDSRLTAEGAIMGTPAYMSPEQAAGDQQKIGPASDIYALGVIMYEMLSGHLPFAGSAGEIFAKKATEPPPPLSQSQRDIDPQLSAICMKALNGNTEDRFESMTEFAEALNAFLDKQDTQIAGATLEAGVSRRAVPTNTNAGETSSLELAADLLAKLAQRIESGDLATEAISKPETSRRLPAWVWVVSGVAATALLVLALLPFLGRQAPDDNGKADPQNPPVIINTQIRISNVYVNNANVVIYLDGKKINPADLKKPVGLKVGKHELVVKEKGSDRVVMRKPFSVAPPKPDGTTATKTPFVDIPPPPPEMDPSFSVWCRKDSSYRENPLHSVMTVNNKTVDEFSTKQNRTVAGFFRPGDWNTLTLTTSPNYPAKASNSLVFDFGPVIKKPNGNSAMRPVWRFLNSGGWKRISEKEYRHQIDKYGGTVKQVPVTFQLYYAGFKREERKLKPGDFVVQAAVSSRYRNPSVTATLFINGVPLTTFANSTGRQAVITDLLHEGENDIRIVSHRVANCLKDNDIGITILGPAEYNTQQSKQLLRPIAAFNAMTGWQRNGKTSRLENTVDPKSDKIERTMTLFLPGPVETVGRSPDKTPQLMAFSTRYSDYIENPLHSQFEINGKVVGMFSSSTRESIEAAFKANDWNVLKLRTKSQYPMHGKNSLKFAIGPAARAIDGKLRMRPVLWSFWNYPNWNVKKGRYYHDIAPEATQVDVTMHLYLGDLKLESQKQSAGAYSLKSHIYDSYGLPSVTATLFINGKPITSFASARSDIILKPPLIKKGINEIRLVTKRVDNALKDNELTFRVLGPAVWNAGKGAFQYAEVLKFTAHKGWVREAGHLKNPEDPKSNTLERALRFEVK